LQKEAQIEQMMRDGVPLGAVAAALASPETAERIAVLEAATSGSLTALDAARLNVRRAGHDLALLNGLHGLHGLHNEHSVDHGDGEEAAELASPLSTRSPLVPLEVDTEGRVMNGHS
jgi:stage V sporulation protein SpoVS